MTRRAALLVVLLAPLLVSAAPTTEEAKAKYVQLRETMEKLAARNAWNGVEDAWLEMTTLGLPLPPELWQLAADCARARGDAWNAYQRLVEVIRARPDDPVAHEQMRIYREGYGRVTVRRVEATPIALESFVSPFDPGARAAIDFAAGTLETIGAFDGMLPTGEYQVGPYPITVVPGLQPVVVQRVVGDGTSARDQKKKKKRRNEQGDAAATAPVPPDQTAPK
jgi:hypothetical protein